MSLTLIPLGVGDAFSAKWYSTSALVRCGGTTVLIDCPHPIRKILAESAPGIDLPDIDAVLLTHLHADHASGLEGYGFFHHFVMQQRAQVWALPAVLQRLRGHLSAGMDTLRQPPSFAPQHHEFDAYFDGRPLQVGGSVQVGDIRVEARVTLHHVPTAALRIHGGGRTLGWSSDTAFDPSLIDWLSDGADLVVHETNLGAHTAYTDLLTLPADVQERMRLVHYPDFFDVQGSEIACLRQGEAVEI